MTSPSDITGLSEIERICNSAEHDAADLVRRLAGQPMQHNISVLRETFKLIRAEAEKQRAVLDSLSARVKELEATVSDQDAIINAFGRVSPQQYQKELAAAEARVKELEAEVFELRHGVADQTDETAYHKERRAAAEQQRDEAYERAATAAWEAIDPSQEGISRRCAEEAVAAIRRLASGPEKP